MLHAGAAVEFEVLVDLRTPLTHRRLVQRELHPVISAGDHLGHQRGVLSSDVFTDELPEVGEAHHSVIETDPFFHSAEFNVGRAMVEGLEVLRRVVGRLATKDRLGGDETGQEHPGVAGPVDQRMPGLAEAGDSGRPDGAVFVARVVRLRHYGRALGKRVRDRPIHIGHLQALRCFQWVT
jgi:hypothetical protein